MGRRHVGLMLFLSACGFSGKATTDDGGTVDTPIIIDPDGLQIN